MINPTYLLPPQYAQQTPLSDTGKKRKKENVHASIEQRKTSIRNGDEGHTDKKYQEGKIHQRQTAKRKIREVKILNQNKQDKTVASFFLVQHDINTVFAR